MTHRFVVTAALLLISLYLTAHAADPPETPASESSEPIVASDDVARWIQQLQSPEFEIRREAAQHLKAAGDTAVPALRAAAASDDLELKLRVQQVLDSMDAARAEALQREGAVRISELIDTLQQTEQRLADIDIVWRREYEYSGPENDEGITRFIHELRHDVAQGELFYQKCMSLSETVEGDPSSGITISAFDGARTVGVTLGMSAPSDAHGWTAESRVDDYPQTTPPFTWISNPHAHRQHPPISVMLSGRYSDEQKLHVRYEGRDRVGDFECEKVSIRFAKATPPLNDAPDYVYWLSEKHGGLPIRCESYFDLEGRPQVIGRVIGFRELEPDVWCPLHVESTYFLDGSQESVRWRTTFTVERVSVHPKRPAEFFSDVWIPYGTPVTEFKDGEQAPAGFHNARFSPATTQIILQQSATDEFLETALNGLERLEHLDLYKSLITDAGLAHLQKAPHLRSLQIQHTQITDAGLANLRHILSLERLDISGTPVSDAGLEHLEQLTGLTSLKLDECEHITGSGFKHLSGAERLRSVTAIGCLSLNDVALRHLAQHQTLEWLQLEGTAVTDEGLQHLKGLKSLDLLSLRGCPNVTTDAVNELKTALPQCRVLY